MPPQVRRSWKKIRQIVTTKIMQKNMVKNWTVALKLKLKLHLWGTLCLVKSLWFNKKKLTKNTFWFHGNFFNSTKIYRTKSCRKKNHNTLPLPYYFFISTHFFLLFTIFLDQFLLIQFQFFVVVCELNTAAYKHGRRLHRKSADFDTGNASLSHPPLFLWNETTEN